MTFNPVELGNGPGGLRPPAPSLIGKLLPMLRSTEETLTKAVLRLDDVASWDARETNHEGVLVAIEAVVANRTEWVTTMMNGLQSLWLKEATLYNDYKASIHRTLAIRHAAELGCMFPRMRKAVTGDRSVAVRTAEAVPSVADQAAPATAMLDTHGADDAAVLDALRQSDEQARMRKHANEMGFDADPANTRLNLLLQRQLKEKGVFVYVTGAHAEMLAQAKFADTQRLRGMLSHVEVQLDGLIAKIERKISMAIQAKTPGHSAAAAASPSNVTLGGGRLGSANVGPSAAGATKASNSSRGSSARLSSAGGGSIPKRPQPPSGPRPVLPHSADDD